LMIKRYNSKMGGWDWIRWIYSQNFSIVKMNIIQYFFDGMKNWEKKMIF
jgi:hypothetical protein